MDTTTLVIRCAEISEQAPETEGGYTVQDIKPASPIRAIDRSAFDSSDASFPIEKVCPVVGMSQAYVRRVLGRNAQTLTPPDVLILLDQDSFAETFVPRSRVLEYLIASQHEERVDVLPLGSKPLFEGCALTLLKRMPPKSVQCLITSTPYWAMRLYEDMQPVRWADGEVCPLGMEQTPEGFIRHSVEILVAAYSSIKDDGSLWWNLMDTYNTRTQIRSNAAEALRAMQGKDKNSWHDYECRRYSAGHAYLKDGEQCTIPFRIAERASRVGYFVKSVISWAKTGSMPEPQKSRVSRSVEYVIHLTKQRTPYFDKDAYLALPQRLGGRNLQLESEKLSDFWYLPTSSGRDGHGAQFPLALAGRCIALSSRPGDVVLDPFVGAGTSAVAAKVMLREFIGFDVSAEYLSIANRRLNALQMPLTPTMIAGKELPDEDY